MKQVAIITIAILLLGNAAFAAGAPPSKPALPAWFDKQPEDAVNIIPMKQGFLVNGKRCSKFKFLKYALYQKVNAAPLLDRKKKISGLSVVIRPEVGVQWARMQEAFTACVVNGIYRVYMQTGPDTVRRIFFPVDGGITTPFGTEVEGATRVILDPKEPDKVTIADERSTDKVELKNFKAKWNMFEGRYEGIIQALPGVKGKDLLRAVRAMKKAGCENIYYAPQARAVRFQFKTPRILADKIVEKPIIMMEEEVEITKDIPRGTSFDKLSGRNLDSTSVEDAYGLGTTGTGAYGQRFGKKSLVKEGGSPGTEAAVLAGLRWLHFHQDKPSGKWDIDDYQKNCKGPGAPCSHMNSGAGPAATFDAGVTGLALLAYLGHGQTHRVGKFKRTVRRGLKYLISVQDSKTGRFGNTEGESWIYNHAIATMAVCEAYAMTLDNSLKGPAQKAVDYIVQARNPGYGWKYEHEPKDGKNDTSITGWMVMALHAAKMGKLTVPQSCFDGAAAWVDRVTRVSDGKVGYMRPGDSGAKLAGRPADTYKSLPTMTAVAVMCRIFCGQKRSHKKIRQGADLLMANLPDFNKPRLDKVNFYYWYHGTYAMFQVGGPKWKTWNNAMKKALLKTQRAGRICQDGSWDPIGEWCVVGGRVYSTAMNVLTLQAYYRYSRRNVPEKKKENE
jgi:hypothetical protein